LNEIVAVLWLAFVLAGFALALFFNSGLSHGFSIDLTLPLYVLMIAWVALPWIRPGGGGPGDRDAGKGEPAHGG
jgi:hypothetical protein